MGEQSSLKSKARLFLRQPLTIKVKSENRQATEDAKKVATTADKGRGEKQVTNAGRDYPAYDHWRTRLT